MIPAQPWGVAFNVCVPVIKRSAVDFALSGDWTPATGDVKVSQDEGAFANVGSLPTALGSGWKIILSAAEMQATSKVVVQIVDSATKAVEDQEIIIPIDYGVRSGTAQAGAAGSVTLDASASATTDFYKGSRIDIVGGTGVGQSRICTAYNGTSKVATVGANWAVNPDNTSIFRISWSREPLLGTDGFALVSVGTGTGQINASSGKVPATVAAGDIANDAITAAALAADAGTEIANAILTLANGIESGIDLRGAIRIIAALCAGKIADAGTGTETFKGLDKLTTRAVLTVDSSGNRSDANYTP